MAPLTSEFEFAYHVSVSSLEPRLGKTSEALEELAAWCDSGEAYEQRLMNVRRKQRLISTPFPELDSVQRRINELLFPVDLQMSAEVNGYVAWRSTRTNALPHLGRTHLQKFDIKEFFNSITTPQIKTSLIEAGFGQDAAQMLARLVSCRGRLPLGARTSPRISNIVLGRFDDAMSSLANSLGLVFTRYADDLSFSSNASFDISADVEIELVSHGFVLNTDKTRSFRLGQPMFVTGLAISDTKYPRIRKRLKSRLRQEFYFVEKYGMAEHARKIGRDAGRTASRMMGQFHYARSIEPDFTTKLAHLYPNTFAAIIPTHTDESVERVVRHRREFLDAVNAAPPGTLPFYRPSSEIGTN